MAKFIGNTDIIDGIAGVVEASSGAVSKEAVFNAIENSIADIMRQKYGINSNIIVKMNRNSGEVQIHRIMLVVEAVNDFDNEIDLNRAKMYNAEAKIGDSLDESLPHLHIERSIVSNMRDTILREIKSLEREAEYREFNTKIGQMFTGYVKKATKYNAIIAIGQKTEAIILKDGLIPGERLNEGDKITAIIQEVKRSDTEFQIILSRSSNEFLMRMLRDEVPEIDDNLIEIKGIVRDPGSRAKVAVFSPDNKVDAVGACIGPRGSRIKNLVNELKNEKIDIVSWSRDIETYIKNAMVPAKVIKINMEKQDGKDKAEVIVAEDQINIAIGRRGQNVRLVAKLAGVDIEILRCCDKNYDITRCR
jgi:N utilization substance protein A